MSPMTRFIIRALPTLVGFIIGAFVALVIVSEIDVYGMLSTVLTIAAGLALGFVGFRIGNGFVERRDREAYGDPGYPDQPYDQGPGYGPPPGPYGR